MEAATRANTGRSDDGDSEKRRLVYIKDWHLVRQERQLARRNGKGEVRLPLPYTTPDVFADDWMNLDYSSEEEEEDDKEVADDFRFCYAGMAGTRTGLHRDVYTSYSWSTNIVGRKRWTMYSPSLGPLLHRKTGRGAKLSAEEEDELQRRIDAGERVVVDQEVRETKVMLRRSGISGLTLRCLVSRSTRRFSFRAIVSTVGVDRNWEHFDMH